MRHTIVSVFTHLYAWLLRLYPSNFREEFGEEMAGVLREQLEEAAARGVVQLLQSCWREVRDWPIHCFKTHWQLRQKRLAIPTAVPPTWWDTAMAGFPYLLFALIISGSALFFLVGHATGLLIGLLMGFGFVFLLLVVLTVAWWRRWPVWSAAWLGFLFFVLLVLFLPGYSIDWLSQGWQLQPVRYLISEIGFPLLWLVFLYLLVARWPHSGLVAMLPPLGITWLLYLEFVPENVRLVVTAVAWVWLGIVAIMLLRWRHHNWDVWLIYLAGGVIGIMFVFAAHYLTGMQLRNRTLAGMGEDVLSELIPELTPLVGILLLLTLRHWSQVNNYSAVRSYRFFLTGTVLTCIGLQARLVMNRRLDFSWPANYSFISSAILLVGSSLMILGIWLVVKDRKQWLPKPNWLLLGLLVPLPLVANIRWITIVYGHGSVWSVSRLTSIAWLALAAWLIGALRDQLPPVPAKTKTRSSSVPLPGKTGYSTGPQKITGAQLVALVIGFVYLVILILPATTLAILFPNNQTQPFDAPTSLPLFAVMAVGQIVMVILLSYGFKLFMANLRLTAIFFFSLSALLLAAGLRNYYWLAIWDSTYDSLGVLWLFLPIMGVFVGTLILVVTLPERIKWAAITYLILLPAALLIVTQLSQSVDYRQETEIRAERISQALDAYHDQEGQYPANLDQLTPRYLLSLSEPMIIFDQEWCYKGSKEQYQFGYVYREHWSDPNLFGRVYKGVESAGEDTRSSSLCQAQITKLQARDPSYYSLLVE